MLDALFCTGLQLKIEQNLAEKEINDMDALSFLFLANSFLKTEFHLKLQNSGGIHVG